MKYKRYITAEGRILNADGGTIRARWEYGRMLLADSEVTTEAGHFRHGQIARLIELARLAGHKLTEQEIQRRLRCARTYLTEAEIRECTHGFQNWDELARAGFPAVEVPDEPGEHGTIDCPEQSGTSHEVGSFPGEQMTLFGADRIPADTYGPHTELRSLRKYVEERKRMTAGFAKADAEVEAIVDELLAAVDGDENATWAKASQALAEQRAQEADEPPE